MQIHMLDHMQVHMEDITLSFLIYGSIVENIVIIIDKYGFRSLCLLLHNHLGVILDIKVG